MRSAGSVNQDAVSRALHELAGSLAADGFSVTCGGFAGPTMSTPLVTYVLAPTGEAYRGRLATLRQHLTFTGRSIFHLWNNRSSVDVLVTVDTPPGIAFLGVLARWISRGQIRHVAYVMDLFYADMTEVNCLRAWRRLLVGGVERRSLASARCLVVLGECMADRLAEWCGIGRDRITVIPMWQDERTMQEQPWPKDEGRLLRLLYAGYAGERHPLESLRVIATEEAASVAGRLKVLLAGTGPGMDQLAEQSKACATIERIATRPLPPAEYLVLAASAHAHIVVLRDSSTGTCVPSKGYAAFAMGRPVLFLGDTRSQIALDIMHGDCGWVIPGGDATALLGVLAMLALHPDVLRDAGRRARQFFEAGRSLSAASDSWQRFLVSEMITKHR